MVRYVHLGARFMYGYRRRIGSGARVLAGCQPVAILVIPGNESSDLALIGRIRNRISIRKKFLFREKGFYFREKLLLCSIIQFQNFTKD